MKKDCTECTNCDYIRGFMCSCRYSYDKDGMHYQVGQDVPRTSANKCEFYTTKKGNRDKFFVL